MTGGWLCSLMHNYGVTFDDEGGVACVRAVVGYLAEYSFYAENGVMGGEGEREGIEDRAVVECVSDMDRDGVAVY